MRRRAACDGNGVRKGFKPPAHLAVRLSASHMTVSQEHDAVATVLIIGAIRGIGLEAVKAALEAGHARNGFAAPRP